MSEVKSTEYDRDRLFIDASSLVEYFPTGTAISSEFLFLVFYPFFRVDELIDPILSTLMSSPFFFFKFLRIVLNSSLSPCLNCYFLASFFLRSTARSMHCITLVYLVEI